MIYVQRDKNGVLCGLYANPQPQPDGTSLTEKAPLADNHPDVLAFLAPKLAAKQETVADLKAALIAKGVL